MALVDQNKFNMINSGEPVPTGIAFLDFDKDFSHSNLTIRWFDINQDGTISLEEYKATLGQQ
jgi:hypothetical protein